jgi:hypothetical protein
VRVIIGGRGPFFEFLPSHIIWDNLQIPEDQKYRLEHPWKGKVFYISPFDLFLEGEPVITKLEKKKTRAVGE